MARHSGAIKPRLTLLAPVLLLPLLGTDQAAAQSVVINEYMTSNRQTIADEEGGFPDWFELFNGSASSVSLDGWSLSDHPTGSTSWPLPSLTLRPAEHLLIFASGRTDRPLARFHETVVRPGDSCRYLLPLSEPEFGWYWPDIDDSSWRRGRLSVGFGDGDDSTVVPQAISVYLRMDFIVEDSASVRYAVLHADYDDAFIAYVNGWEIARANIDGWPPLFDALADEEHEAKMYRGEQPEMFFVKEFASFIRPGRNVLSFQVHNVDRSSDDLSIIPYLTMGLDSLPTEPRGTPDFLSGAILPLHSDFKLQGGNDTLVLRRADGTTADSVVVIESPPDVSYGRAPDGSDVWRYFISPSPGGANPSQGAAIYTPRPVIEPQAGFYGSPVSVLLSNDSSLARTYYTLDGSPPSETSFLYSGPISLDTSTVVRAMSLIPGEFPSSDRTSSFIIGSGPTLPVISLSTDPLNLWDPDSGIYVTGPVGTYDPEPPNRGANFWEDWERPVHVEFFEADGREGFELDAGLKIHGGWTRYFEQKSLRIQARAKYGDGSIDYRVFPERNRDRFESLIIRNGGSDWTHTLFRDPLLTGLVKDEAVDVSAYRPVVVYINGAYWGVQDLRERLDEHYVADVYRTDPDSVDVLEVWGEVMAGNIESFDELNNFLSTSDLSSPASYARANELIDIERYIPYVVTQIYVNNGDWPGNNHRLFHIQRPDEPFRWFLIDLDFGFGLHDSSGYRYNSLADAVSPNGSEWPNPPYATLYLRKLLENLQFRIDFINGFADLMNFRFQPADVLRAIDEKRDLLAPEIERHLARWGRDLEDWNGRIEEMRPFAMNRPAFMREIVEQHFNLPGHANVTLESNPPAGGTIRINGRRAPSTQWTGTYFRTVPLIVEAVPQPGYRFAGWTGGLGSSERRAMIALDNDRFITALFTRTPGVPGVPVINEINYNSADSFETGDWIEFHALGGDVDLNGWWMTDEDSSHRFYFPADLTIPMDSQAIVAEDTALFRSHFEFAQRLCGDLGFGLSRGGDAIKLYNPAGMLIDSVSFDDEPPWPPEPDGGGATLELREPGLPNSEVSSWRVSVEPYGSPGASNAYHRPESFSLLFPANGSRVPNDSVVVVWSRSIDLDAGESVRYWIEWSAVPTFEDALSEIVTDTSYTIVRGGPLMFDVAALPDRTRFYWRVTAIDDLGHSQVCEQGEQGWSFEVFLVEIPAAFAIRPVFPNPFNDRARLTVDLPTDGDLEVSLYDVRGRRISFDKQHRNAGSYSFNLPDAGSGELASGIYLAVAKSQGKTRTAKMVLVK